MLEPTAIGADEDVLRERQQPDEGRLHRPQALEPMRSRGVQLRLEAGQELLHHGLRDPAEVPAHHARGADAHVQRPDVVGTAELD